MSVIGPRPGLWNQDILTAERDKYGVNDVKPGLTGWAQINGRDELEIPDKAKLDGDYVQNMGLKMDAKCFLAIVFYGKGFEECGVIITMLSIILVTSSWANIIRTQYLIPNSKEKTYIIAVVCGAALNLLLNGIFIPIMGAKGAAIGTIGAELILCIIHTVGVWKDLELKKSLKDWALYCLCAFIMFIAVRLVRCLENLPKSTKIVYFGCF